jgi:cytidylate kinase
MIITVSRQLGSLGGKLGETLAQRLGYVLMDREILQRAAEAVEVSEEVLLEADERRPTIMDRIGAFIVGYQPPVVPEYVPADVIFVQQLTHDSYRRLVEGVIQEIAARDNAVIIGRGAQVVLRGDPRAVHVHVYAPFEVRVQRLAERDRISEQTAARIIRESDQNRAGFVKSYYGVDWQDPSLYDLMINTGRISLDVAVDLVLSVIASRAAQPPTD